MNSGSNIVESTRFTVLATPIGPVELRASGGSLCGLYLPETRHPPAPAGRDDASEPVLVAAARQLAEYFAGQRRTFELPLCPQGTPFQQRVWRQLLEIPYGSTCSYGALARALAHPGASRAVGAANGRNPISIIIPCHRVIGSDGSLTGYGGGEPAKRWLLAHEARSARELPAPRGQSSFWPDRRPGAR
jgi:methylated-DNA-[protein]-cysteine S-methyltransferase